MSHMSKTDSFLTIRSYWFWVLAYALLIIFTGCVALFNPIVAGLASGSLLGLLVFGYGVTVVVSGLSSHSGQGRWLNLCVGLLTMGTGLFTLAFPLASAISIVWVIGFLLAVLGISQIITAVQGADNRIWGVASGLLDLLLSGLLLSSGPAASLVVLATIVGVSLLFRGISLFIIALGLRRLGRRTEA